MTPPTRIPDDGAERGGGEAEAREGLGPGTRIPDDHPRAHSLRTRERLKDAVEAGLVHATGLVAHGRGEAFDYLLGETTVPEAGAAIQEAARLLRGAEHPVLSLNGNVVALAAQECLQVAEALPGVRLEVNLFHRTDARIRRLLRAMEKAGAPPGTVLGAEPDFAIPGLASDRAKCCKHGIGDADVVLVPLEDGDRCQALKDMGKTVLTIDLNPLSRTARTADVTIVDELTRAMPILAKALRAGEGGGGFDNGANLAAVRHRMARGLTAAAARLDDEGT